MYLNEYFDLKLRKSAKMLLKLWMLHMKMTFSYIKFTVLMLWGQEERSCSSKPSRKVISALFFKVELCLGGEGWIQFYFWYSITKSSIPKPLKKKIKLENDLTRNKTSGKTYVLPCDLDLQGHQSKLKFVINSTLLVLSKAFTFPLSHTCLFKQQHLQKTLFTIAENNKYVLLRPAYQCNEHGTQRISNDWCHLFTVTKTQPWCCKQLSCPFPTTSCYCRGFF